MKTIYERVWRRFNCDAATEEEAECYARTDRRTQIRHLTHNGTCIFFDLLRFIENAEVGKAISDLSSEEVELRECDEE